MDILKRRNIRRRENNDQSYLRTEKKLNKVFHSIKAKLVQFNLSFFSIKNLVYSPLILNSNFQVPKDFQDYEAIS